MQVAELYRGRQDFDVGRLVAELVEAESVPLLPVLRYKPSGLDKRQAWERTWELQRQEDAIDARTQAVARRSQLSDRRPGTNRETPTGRRHPRAAEVHQCRLPARHYWRLRGKLDVPKERWVSFPHCEGEDGTLVVAWAGYDHLQLAQAISALLRRHPGEAAAATDPRLVPLLAGLLELVPWLKQWHNELDPEFDNMRMGDYFAGFVEQEARDTGPDRRDVRAWQPPRRAAAEAATTEQYGAG